MLRNPIHLRLEKLESWQHVTFMASLCERMYPNYQAFCLETGFGEAQLYRRILDLIWETLVVKDAKVNFDSQLEKLEEAVPSSDDYDLYGVYPAIDACIALGELIHSRLSGETLSHAIAVSETSIRTVAMLEMTQAGKEIAKTKDGYRDGRPPLYSEKQISHALELLKSNSYSQVEAMTGISKPTLIRAKRKAAMII